AGAAYRRSALQRVGLLDERMFMYGEELDLALRLAADGWRSTAVTSARGTHVGGATVGRHSARQRELSGFGRGYLLRAYGVLRTRAALRAAVVEAIVCVVDAARSRDLASTRGRLRGWRAGRSADARPRNVAGLERDFGFVDSLRFRQRSAS
ncbi:MAG: glycosyltransferase family 2 protein, partial [Solirubrobacteraceae bacterium]